MNCYVIPYSPTTIRTSFLYFSVDACINLIKSIHRTIFLSENLTVEIAPLRFISTAIQPLQSWKKW